MRIGEIFRYGRPYSPELPVIDGLPNFFRATFTEGHRAPQLEKGINPLEETDAIDKKRRPAIIICSSPGKIGVEETPWQDFFDPDNGHIRFYGDNRLPTTDPALRPGNRLLLDAFVSHSAAKLDIRKYSTPIIFFKRVPYRGKSKGHVQFQGFGVVEKVSLVSQYDRKNDRSFPNYAFDFVVLDISTELEDFSWEWISKRRSRGLGIDETVEYAPKSWKLWIRGGLSVVERCRRKVSRMLVEAPSEQRPERGSQEDAILRLIYEFYHGRKARFELLAAVVTQRVLSKSGGQYVSGWITRSGSDNGIDFVGRLDLGTGFSKVKIVVLGQAKCEALKSPTNGLHIARTVARLRRGWVGAYVTTSYFSPECQREVIEDRYPILMIHGKRLAQEVNELTSEAAYRDATSFLESLDAQYESSLQSRNPEEILLQ